MEQLGISDLRRLYVSFFVARQHVPINSSSLIPTDGSALFTTAGMHPLVPYLRGQVHPSGRRLVDYQKCVRTTDIAEVGDATHLTLFEMLGNWSLGDYFKEDSIRWSYEFLTSDEGLGIPEDRLWITVFEGNDQICRDEESAQLWMRQGIDRHRIQFLGSDDNWWSMGSEGLCGPDTEIFFDRTGVCCPTEPIPLCRPGTCEHGRFVEIWNNVFMTYDRNRGSLIELSQRNVDTGMGLERTVSMLVGAASVYDIQPLSTIMAAIRESAPETFSYDAENLKHVRGLRILTDHLRTATFILGDQTPIKPSNQGAGYVLRRLIRRGVRYCQELGIPAGSWSRVHRTVVECYCEAYPELSTQVSVIEEQLDREIERFSRTLNRGSDRLSHEIGAALASHRNTLEGSVAFTLHDTYGFPIELTQEMAGERGIEVDIEEYRFLLEAQRARSRRSS